MLLKLLQKQVLKPTNYFALYEKLNQQLSKEKWFGKGV